MEVSMGTEAPQKLTDKGQATRAHILQHAADLIYIKGVHATNNELVRSAAGISGSQLTHYFPNKERLVLAVISWQADSILGFHRSERFAGFDSIDAFQDWADFYILSGRPFEDGCSLGSLASEIVKTDLDVHDQLARVFEQWRDVFSEGLERMQRLGQINASADPIRLANMFIAAYQGGMLLAQVARDIAPLRDSLYAAVDYLRTFAK
jgi:AcrR family transcriptional regulator